MNLSQKVKNYQVNLRKKRIQDKILETRKKFIDQMGNCQKPADYKQGFLYNHSQNLEASIKENSIQKFEDNLTKIHQYIFQFDPYDQRINELFDDFLESSLYDVICEYLQKVNFSNHKIEFTIFCILSNITAGPNKVVTYLLSRSILSLFQSHLYAQQDMKITKRILCAICNLVQEDQGAIAVYNDNSLIETLRMIYESNCENDEIQECFIWFFDGIYRKKNYSSKYLDEIFIDILGKFSNEQKIQKLSQSGQIELTRSFQRYLESKNDTKIVAEKLVKTQFQQNFLYFINQKNSQLTSSVIKIIYLLSREEDLITSQIHSKNLIEKLIQNTQSKSKEVKKYAISAVNNFMLNNPNYLTAKNYNQTIESCLKISLKDPYESSGVDALGFIYNFLQVFQNDYQYLQQIEQKFNIIDNFLNVIMRGKERLTFFSLNCLKSLLEIGQKAFIHDQNLFATQLVQNEKSEILQQLNTNYKPSVQFCQQIIMQYIEPLTDSNMITEQQLIVIKTYQIMKKYTNQQKIEENPTLEKLIKYYHFEDFNLMQKQVAQYIFNNNQNLLISSPTGSGKTALFEFCIFKQLGINLICKNQIIIYISPLKAICQEILFKWQNKFKKINPNFVIQEITSDNEKLNLNKNVLENLDQENLISEGLIIATPEKLNNILRKWKQNQQFLERISLVMIDEIHTIDDESRGVVLESMITRLKFLSTLDYFKDYNISNIRLIALSASLKNEKDFCHWLKIPRENFFKFGSEFRPVQLQKRVLGYYQKSNDFMFDVSLNYKLTNVIQKYSQSKPVLVFVSTQKSTVKTCKDLIQLNDDRYFINDENHFQLLLRLSSQAANVDLKFCLMNGLGFHNGSLVLEDRRLVENAFKSHSIRILITTSTLAMGVNLPAYMVIIKGTKGYRGRPQGYVEYEYHEIQQMMGRAGRPQFEKEGIVIVMTSRENVDRIEGFMNDKYQGRNIQSNFQDMLSDNLNNEIALRTVKNQQEAQIFIKNSLYYSIEYNKRLQNLDQTIFQQIQESFNILKQQEFIIEEQIQDKSYVNTTQIGFEAARQNYSLKSFLLFKKEYPQTFENILQCLSQSYEFENFRSTQKQRKELAELNKKNQFVIKKKSIKNYDQKIFVLLQSIWNREPIRDWEIKMQLTQIRKQAISILFFYKKFYQVKNCFRQKITCMKLIKYLKMKNNKFHQYTKIYDNEKVNKNLLNQIQKKDIVCLEGFLKNREEFYKRLPNFQKKILNEVLDFEYIRPNYSWSLQNNQNNTFELHIQNKSNSNKDKHLSTYYNIYNKQTNKFIKFGYFFQKKYQFIIKNQPAYQLQIYLFNNHFVNGDVEFEDLVKPFKDVNTMDTEMLNKVQKTVKKLTKRQIGRKSKTVNTNTKVKLIKSKKTKNDNISNSFVENLPSQKEFKPMDILRQRRKIFLEKQQKTKHEKFQVSQ